MLTTYRKGACVLAAALSVMAGAAHAKNHTVLIVDGGYFPAVTYADVGDIIRFENASSASHEVGDPNQTWTSGDIAVDADYSLTIQENTPLEFTGMGADGLQVNGSISFDAPPLAD